MKSKGASRTIEQAAGSVSAHEAMSDFRAMGSFEDDVAAIRRENAASQAMAQRAQDDAREQQAAAFRERAAPHRGTAKDLVPKFNSAIYMLKRAGLGDESFTDGQQTKVGSNSRALPLRRKERHPRFVRDGWSLPWRGHVIYIPLQDPVTVRVPDDRRISLQQFVDEGYFEYSILGDDYDEDTHSGTSVTVSVTARESLEHAIKTLAEFIALNT